MKGLIEIVLALTIAALACTAHAEGLPPRTEQCLQIALHGWFPDDPGTTYTVRREVRGYFSVFRVKAEPGIPMKQFFITTRSNVCPKITAVFLMNGKPHSSNF